MEEQLLSQKDLTVSRFEQIIGIIKKHQAELMTLPGVLGVVPGFGGEDGMQEIIVLVLNSAEFPADYPRSIEGIGVEARVASPLELRQGMVSLSNWEGVVPEAAPRIGYRAPDSADLALSETEVASILCHVGPDSGWSVLKPFLAGAKSRLTVAMYEFYATHIVDFVSELSRKDSLSLQMILQVDKNDLDAPERLNADWGNRLKFVKASVSGSGRIFNNSYHTKVAVRDSSAFWLSSGNWSPNSQPLVSGIDPKTIYNAGNREWHVIIENEKLALMYEGFIEYDMKQASEASLPESEELLPDLFVRFPPEPEAAFQQPHPFKEQLFEGEKIKVKPLMSPDNYASEVLKLIRQAEQSIYLQFSYIRQPSTEVFNQIIGALAEKMAQGLDVKIIVGASQDAKHSDLLIGKRGWLRSCFRQQRSKLHNKGILIDGRIAVVGSNNWSSDGTQYNRDTSLVFYSQQVYGYYNEVFKMDWDNLTRPIAMAVQPEVMIAPEGVPAPAGMTRVSWNEWYG